MKHFTFSLFALAILLPLGAHAQEIKTAQEEYLVCKQAALTKRENTMRPALAKYVEETTRITDTTKEKLDTIKWYIDSSYKKSSEKILKEAEAKMIPVNTAVARTRFAAQATWKAEDALCEFTESKKVVSKK
jgi:ABC-type uncharacterized transport system substrate-binding protein